MAEAIGGLPPAERSRALDEACGGDAALHRKVAIKLLGGWLTQDAERAKRFKQEARTLASLNHPNIVTIYSLEHVSDTDFLTMELVEGPSLDERIAAGPIPLADAIGIARQISEALGTAHARGIVHRDLKPANVKLTTDGKVKVLDFGLAKSAAQRPGDMAEVSGALAEARATFSAHGDADVIKALERGQRPAGYAGAIRDAAETLAARARTQYVMGFRVALLHAHAGERKVAIDWLERAYEQHGALLEYIRVSPEFEVLRPDPRFHDLLRRLNLADDQVARSST